MKKYVFMLLCIFNFSFPGAGQVMKPDDGVILFHGLIYDAGTEKPVPQSQIFINRVFTSVSDSEGKFGFYVNRNDTVIFRSLGYKTVEMHINDTLKGKEFLAGVFMHADTVTIGEVIIIPRIASLRSDLMRPSSDVNTRMNNAKYNLAVSAYQGRVNQSKLGDPAMNYEMLRQQQKQDAYSKGQIPPDKIAGISPLLLIPAAYLLINGLPEKPSFVKPVVTSQEVEIILSRYLESVRQKEK